ncbi:MAG: hypothetical protein QOC99_2306 [Acidobacteriota bacterium]|nr:hypothetical protein [Acidobacteriota bacterium]
MRRKSDREGGRRALLKMRVAGVETPSLTVGLPPLHFQGKASAITVMAAAV